MTENQTATSWSSVQETLAEYRSQCNELERWMEVELSFIEELCAGLDQKIAIVENQRSLIAEERRRNTDQNEEVRKLTEQVEQQESQLSDVTEKLSVAEDELNRNRELFEAQLHEASHHPSPEILKSLEKAEKERDELLTQLEDSQGKLKNLDMIEGDLNETKRELAESKSTIEDFQLAAQENINDRSIRDSLERESAALDSELERVRGRAAELYETVEEQKRELTQQRVEMGEELRSLRKVIESLVSDKSQAAVQPLQQTNANRGAPEEGKPAKAPLDPIVNSVMAQFAQLQQEVQQRRAGKQ